MHISMLHDYCEYAERMEVRYMDVDVDMDTYRWIDTCLYLHLYRHLCLYMYIYTCIYLCCTTTANTLSAWRCDI